jgi:hypothetical protein
MSGIMLCEDHDQAHDPHDWYREGELMRCPGVVTPVASGETLQPGPMSCSNPEPHDPHIWRPGLTPDKPKLCPGGPGILIANAGAMDRPIESPPPAGDEQAPDGAAEAPEDVPQPDVEQGAALCRAHACPHGYEAECDEACQVATELVLGQVQSHIDRVRRERDPIPEDHPERHQLAMLPPRARTRYAAIAAARSLLRGGGGVSTAIAGRPGISDVSAVAPLTFAADWILNGTSAASEAEPESVTALEGMSQSDLASSVVLQLNSSASADQMVAQLTELNNDQDAYARVTVERAGFAEPQSFQVQGFGSATSDELIRPS